ncbi:MAG: molybdopterin molybdenumtransferase MoeA [Chloroflexi bacterium]|nr:molybdopterin molybdenumtransferase MoeA [Chloroflexota bacterium]HCU72745.1 molybdopterin molybdenumtransferase MoeA [Chloroflexota bacterium]
MPTNPAPLSVDEALDRILRAIEPLPAAKVGLDRSLGLVSAVDVKANDHVPGFDNSAFDGYAVHAADLANASADCPVTLNVIDEIPAGHISPTPVHRGEAARIMTGASIPAGADAIVPFEDTDRRDWGQLGTSPRGTDSSNQSTVSVQTPVSPGENIRPAGGDILKGDLVIEAGTTIGAPTIGVLASVAVTNVSIHPRARVAIVPTGDEVVEIDADFRPGLVRNSNAWALEAASRAIGAAPKRQPIVGDSVEELRLALQSASETDIVVTIGGVSMGDLDLVKHVLAGQGEMDFWQVNMRPGKPLAFGVVNGTPLIGLPGNPVSSMVGFMIFVRPALLRLMGHTDLLHPRIHAVAGENLYSSDGKRTYVRVTIERENDRLVCRSAGDQGSYRMSSLTEGKGLAVIYEGQAISTGDPVEILVIDDTVHQL